MKKVLITIFSLAIILTFIILAFNYKDIIERPIFDSVPSVYLTVDDYSTFPYSWSINEYEFYLSDELSKGQNIVMIDGSYNGYSIGSCEGCILSDENGATLEYVYIPDIICFEKCVRYDINNTSKHYDYVFSSFMDDNYMYNLNDTWLFRSGAYKFERKRPRTSTNSDVYLHFKYDDENITITYCDVPLKMENFISSLSSSVEYLNDNKPQLPTSEDNNDILDSFKDFVSWFKVVLIEYPAHYYKYVSFLLEDFNILWQF